MILDEPLDDWMIEKLNSRLKVWKVSWRPRLTKMEAMCNTSTIAFIQQSWQERMPTAILKTELSWLLAEKSRFAVFLGGHIRVTAPKSTPQKLAARASYDGINFPNLKLTFFRSLHPKKGGEKSSDPFFGFFNFRCEFFATKAPYPKYPPSVKHWAGCPGFQCLPAILCSEDPVGQTPQAPKWKRPVMPAPPISIAEIRHAAKIHKVYGIYGWNIWAVKDLTAFTLPLRNPTFAMGCLM